VGLATDLPANTDVFPAPIFDRDKLQSEIATEYKINTPGLLHLTGSDLPDSWLADHPGWEERGWRGEASLAFLSFVPSVFGCPHLIVAS